jgi:transcriptional regulator with XRE-family HTH domain
MRNVVKSISDSDILSKFGEALRRLREAAEETRDELGAALGVEGDTVGTWERGSRSPKLPELVRIARRYHVSLSQLADDAPLPPDMKVVQGIDLSSVRQHAAAIAKTSRALASAADALGDALRRSAK